MLKHTLNSLFIRLFARSYFRYFSWYGFFHRACSFRLGVNWVLGSDYIIHIPKMGSGPIKGPLQTSSHFKWLNVFSLSMLLITSMNCLIKFCCYLGRMPATPCPGKETCDLWPQLNVMMGTDTSAPSVSASSFDRWTLNSFKLHIQSNQTIFFLTNSYVLFL